MLGIGQDGVRKIPTDKDFRMDTKALAAAIQKDKQNGFLPFAVVATIGTTATTSIDPVEEMVNLMGAAQAYQLNVSAVQATKAMISETIQILT